MVSANLSLFNLHLAPFAKTFLLSQSLSFFLSFFLFETFFSIRQKAGPVGRRQALASLLQLKIWHSAVRSSVLLSWNVLKEIYLYWNNLALSFLNANLLSQTILNFWQYST